MHGTAHPFPPRLALEPSARLEQLLSAAEIGTFRLGDGRELPLAAPASFGAWSELLSLLSRDGLRALPLGNGSKLERRPVHSEIDVLVSTRNLAGILQYEPGDGTVTALAGTEWHAIEAVVSAGSHHLTPDVSPAGAPTLGGVVASAQAGIDRLRWGPLRDNVLGIRFVSGDGRVARSGGALVKNVTGYDLHRLHCGAEGSLGVVLEASLRLAPQPSERRILRTRIADRSEAWQACRTLGRLDVQPWTLCLRNEDSRPGQSPWELTLLLAGRQAVVDWEQREAEAAVGGASFEQLPAEAYDDLRTFADNPRGRPALGLQARPSQLEARIEQALQACTARGWRLETRAHPRIASALLLFEPLGGESSFEELELSLARIEGARWRDLPRAQAKNGQRLTGPAAELVRRLRASLDPRGVFARCTPHG